MSFNSHHTVATSSGLKENIKLNNIYRIFTKDDTTETRGVGVYRY